jgi:hypothetical protein
MALSWCQMAKSTVRNGNARVNREGEKLSIVILSKLLHAVAPLRRSCWCITGWSCTTYVSSATGSLSQIVSPPVRALCCDSHPLPSVLTNTWAVVSLAESLRSSQLLVADYSLIVLDVGVGRCSSLSTSLLLRL